MSTDTATREEKRAERRTHRASRRGAVRPRERVRLRLRVGPRVIEGAGALVVAVGVVVVARSAFGTTGPVAVTVLAYLGFVGTMALAEFTRAGRIDEVIDLTAAERLELPPNGAAPGVVHPESNGSAPMALHAVSADEADLPMRRRRLNPADAVEFVVAALAAAAFSEVVRLLFHMRSLVGLALWWYIAFAAIYFLLVRERTDVERALDGLMTVLVVSTGLLVAGVLSWMIVFIAARGIDKLTWSFFTQDLSKTGPLTPGGGAKHAIIGTVEQVGIATLAVVPVGILTAVYLHEIRGRLAAPVRFIVDAMSGLPSIVAGLLVFTVLVEDHGFSGISGSIALAVLMLPTMTRASEEILRTIPDSLREGALALGAPQWRLIQKVVLPTALAGLMTATLLAIARAIGETAPMLLTAFGADTTNWNALKGPQSDLPLFVWKLILEPNKTDQARAFTGALVLVMLVLVLFVSARFLASRSTRKLGRSR